MSIEARSGSLNSESSSEFGVPSVSVCVSLPGWDISGLLGMIPGALSGVAVDHSCFSDGPCWTMSSKVMTCADDMIEF